MESAPARSPGSPPAEESPRASTLFPVADVLRALNQAEDLEAAARILAHAARRACGFERAALDESVDGTWVRRGAAGNPRPACGESLAPACSHPEGSSTLDPARAAAVLGEGCTRGIALPLVVSGNVVGALTVGDGGTGPVDAGHLEALAPLAEVAAATLARLRGRADRDNLETLWLEAERRADLERLGGEAAHELRNALTAILGLADALRADAAPGDSLERAADLLEEAAGRATRLTGFLLPQPAEGGRSADVHEVLLELAELLGPSLAPEVTLRTRFGADSARVSAPAGEWTQVLLNLWLNARDAMPQGGELTVSTSSIAGCITSDTQRLQPHVGSYLVVEIEDTGCGMERDVLERVFEAHFTTKRTGCGMGLPVSRRIVESWGGAIEVESDPDQGTIFRVFAPLPEETGDAPTSPTAARVRGGHVALACREDILRRGTRQLLGSFGETVRAFPDAKSAFDEARDERVHALIVETDLARAAEEGLRELLELRPSLRVLLLGASEGEPFSPELAPRLEGPFLAPHLARIVASRVVGRA